MDVQIWKSPTGNGRLGISGKSLEVITAIIFIRIADIPGSRAKNKLIFRTQCMKLKFWRVVMSRTCLFYSIGLECLTWKHMIIIKCIK